MKKSKWGRQRAYLILTRCHEPSRFERLLSKHGTKKSMGERVALTKAEKELPEAVKACLGAGVSNFVMIAASPLDRMSARDRIPLVIQKIKQENPALDIHFAASYGLRQKSE